ncbi:GH24 family phage-related lysozyme (muramidase) [Azospirillum agricola]|uniref:lysozyme n=1 Tax=Azospirillum agricola TaxID=1720247 RepID=UPI001AE46CBB|nr:lysozyme [Azospirillum agricola]MBP2233143.1 GH24 family phage-related lysozyme (muramidase) [Azospirillum agricola]
MRAIPQTAIDLVMQAEGLRLTAYPDAATKADPWTIGYGHTGADVHRGLKITKADAEELLRADLEAAAAIVDRVVTVSLTDDQRGALISFVFNVGPGRKARGKDTGKDGFVTLRTGKPSTMLVKLNAGDYAGAAAEFSKWTRGDGKVMSGLVKRRAAEAALFLAGEVHAATRSAEPAPAARPVTRSASGLAGLGTLGLGGVAVALDQAREVSAAARGLLEVLPHGVLGWGVAAVLAVAVVALLIRQRADQRQAA